MIKIMWEQLKRVLDRDLFQCFQSCKKCTHCGKEGKTTAIAWIYERDAPPINFPGPPRIHPHNLCSDCYDYVFCGSMGIRSIEVYRKFKRNEFVSDEEFKEFI